MWRSKRFSFTAACGSAADGNAKIVPSAANITVRAPDSGARDTNDDSSLTSKSTVVTARSVPSPPYTGSVTVNPVLCDVKNTRGGSHTRALARVAASQCGRVRGS